jgi:2-C-methyl-D-erythritol 4-phosphate cytidylyltransferase
MKKFAIIVAGGSGLRMGKEIPKQFLLLDGKPIVIHTINKFISEVDEIILVLPESQIAYWEELCIKYNFKHNIKITKGGQTRFQSVKNGLELIHEEGIVAIHDAVRPFITEETIRESIKTALIHSSAIVSISLNDSIREDINGLNRALDRRQYKLIQTPQSFQVNLIKKAYEQEEKSTFTDDASVAENIGIKIHLIEGSVRNIKLTTPIDLIIGEAILREGLGE